ncbi:hypothetical protein DK45_3076 [Bordetella bronchiseptica]|nr:hypothetical protein DK45_3076 [Bordetella bronchiseptica]
MKLSYQIYFKIHILNSIELVNPFRLSLLMKLSCHVEARRAITIQPDTDSVRGLPNT